jgi:hypothetical protein
VKGELYAHPDGGEGAERGREQHGRSPRRPPGERGGGHEHGADHHGHRIGERRHADRQRRPQRVIAGQQRQTGHGERHGQQERVLAVQQVDDDHHGQGDRRQQARRAPGAAHVEVKEQGQQTGREHHDRRGAHEPREKIEDDAVAHHAVRPAVPEIVPDQRLSLGYQPRLVGVGGDIDAGQSDEVHDGQRGSDRDHRRHGERQERPVDRAPRRETGHLDAAAPTRLNT